MDFPVSSFNICVYSDLKNPGGGGGGARGGAGGRGGGGARPPPQVTSEGKFQLCPMNIYRGRWRDVSRIPGLNFRFKKVIIFTLWPF
jgi:hypothetical protein